MERRPDLYTVQQWLKIAMSGKVPTGADALPGMKPGGWSFTGTLAEVIEAVQGPESPFPNKDSAVGIIKAAFARERGEFKVTVFETEIPGLPGVFGVKQSAAEKLDWRNIAYRLSRGSFQRPASYCLADEVIAEDPVAAAYEMGVLELAALRFAGFGIESLTESMIATSLGDYAISEHRAKHKLVEAEDTITLLGGALQQAKTDYDGLIERLETLRQQAVIGTARDYFSRSDVSGAVGLAITGKVAESGFNGRYFEQDRLSDIEAQLEEQRWQLRRIGAAIAEANKDGDTPLGALLKELANGQGDPLALVQGYLAATKPAEQAVAAEA